MQVETQLLPAFIRLVSCSDRLLTIAGIALTTPIAIEPKTATPAA
jgi:hypothetical protein